MSARANGAGHAQTMRRQGSYSNSGQSRGEAAGRADGKRQQRPRGQRQLPRLGRGFRLRSGIARGSGMDERAVTAALGEGDAVTYSRRVARVGVVLSVVMGSTTSSRIIKTQLKV